jgi:hypothetical protein
MVVVATVGLVAHALSCFYILRAARDHFCKGNGGNTAGKVPLARRGGVLLERTLCLKSLFLLASLTASVSIVVARACTIAFATGIVLAPPLSIPSPQPNLYQLLYPAPSYLVCILRGYRQVITPFLAESPRGCCSGVRREQITNIL